MKNYPKVTIIVLNWNNYEDSKECLDSINRLKYPNPDVIVIDNGSNDNSGKRLQINFPKFKYIHNADNMGFCIGNNIGISEALKDKNCKFILILNNDTVVEENFLEELTKIAEKSTFRIYGSFQPKMIYYDNKNLIDSAGILYSKNSLSFNRGIFEPVSKYNKPTDIFGCCAGACLYRREAIDDIIKRDGEFFDEDFFAYYEDVDIAFRLQLMGWKSYFVPMSKVYHKSGRSFNKLGDRSRYYLSRNNIYIIIKNLPLRFILKNLFIILAVQFLTILLNFIKRGNFGFKIIKSKIDALIMYKTMIKKRKLIKVEKRKWEGIEKFFILKWKINKQQR